MTLDKLKVELERLLGEANAAWEMCDAISDAAFYEGFTEALNKALALIGEA